MSKLTQTCHEHPWLMFSDKRNLFQQRLVEGQPPSTNLLRNAIIQKGVGWIVDSNPEIM